MYRCEVIFNEIKNGVPEVYGQARGYARTPLEFAEMQQTIIEQHRESSNIILVVAQSSCYEMTFGLDFD